MTTRPNCLATNLGLQLAATVVAACATLAMFAALRPGELPERTLRWASLRSTPLPQRPGVPDHLLLPRVVAAAPAGAARPTEHPLAITSR